MMKSPRERDEIYYLLSHDFPKLITIVKKFKLTATNRNIKKAAMS